MTQQLSLQGRYNRHGAWVLNGMLIRIAQKMGLHRDGETLGLSPFETEMRRRVWWMILMQDAKYAMLSGLSHSLLPWALDTKVPSNLNDADLFPGSMEPVAPREGETEMAFCMFNYEIGKFLVQSRSTPGFEAVIMGNEIDTPKDIAFRAEQVAKYRSMVDDLEMRLQVVLDRYTDANAGRLHQVCDMLQRSLISKIRSMLVPMKEQPEWGTEILTPKDNLFKHVIANNEHGLTSYGFLHPLGYLWFAKLHFQIDVFILMVGMLQSRTVGTLADKGWSQIQEVYKYHDELFDLGPKPNMMLATFVLRAWKARVKSFAQQGKTLETPACVLQLRELIPSNEGRSSEGTPSTASSEQSTWNEASAIKPDIQMAEVDPIFDQVLNGYIDVTTLDWDIFGDDLSAGNGPDPMATSAFTFGGIGSSGKW